MRYLKLFGLLILFGSCFFWLPIDSSYKMRNALGDQAFKQTRFDLAGWFYHSTARQGNAKGRNNKAVLDYAFAFYAPDATDNEKFAATRNAQAIFEELSDKGYTPAMYNNGIIFHDCSVTDDCYERAVFRLKRAMEMGDPLAPLAYALQLTAYTNHPGIRIEKINRLRKLSEAGHPEAALAYVRLARIDRAGEEAHLRVAVKNNHPYAQYLLGKLTNAPDKALWLEAAANSGNTHAAFERAELAKEQNEGIETVIKWYARAMAEAGKTASSRKKTVAPEDHTHAYLQNTVQYHPTGLRWYQHKPAFRYERATGDNLYAYISARELGLIYLHGKGVPADRERAYEAFRIAGRTPYKMTALLAAQADFESTDHLSGSIREQRHQIRLGFETLEYFKAEQRSNSNVVTIRLLADERPRYPAWLTPEIEQLILDGKLRLVTDIDIANWQMPRFATIDKALVARLATSDTFKNALMVTRKNVTLPELKEAPSPPAIILPYSNIQLIAPISGYDIYKLDRDATINRIE